MHRRSLPNLERPFCSGVDRLRSEGLDAAVAETRQQLVRFLKEL
jgi:hypothetical protein